MYLLYNKSVYNLESHLISLYIYTNSYVCWNTFSTPATFYYTQVTAGNPKFDFRLRLIVFARERGQAQRMSRGSVITPLCTFVQSATGNKRCKLQYTTPHKKMFPTRNHRCCRCCLLLFIRLYPTTNGLFLSPTNTFHTTGRRTLCIIYEWLWNRPTTWKSRLVGFIILYAVAGNKFNWP